MKKKFLQIREDGHTQPIEVNIESPGIAQEDQLFLLTDYVELLSV